MKLPNIEVFNPDIGKGSSTKTKTLKPTMTATLGGSPIEELRWRKNWV